MNNIFNNQCSSQNHLELFDLKEGFMLGNLFKNLYMSYHGFSNYFFQSENERDALLTQYQIYLFACHELNLYLDTHYKDQQAINLFNELQKKKKEIKKIYEEKYGCLEVSSISHNQSFQWIKGPWPWECD